MIQAEKIDTLISTLEFYGDDSMWTECCHSSNVYISASLKDIERDYFGEEIHCGGKLARETLKQIKGE